MQIQLVIMYLELHQAHPTLQRINCLSRQFEFGAFLQRFSRGWENLLHHFKDSLLHAIKRRFTAVDFIIKSLHRSGNPGRHLRFISCELSKQLSYFVQDGGCGADPIAYALHSYISFFDSCGIAEHIIGKRRSDFDRRVYLAS